MGLAEPLGEVGPVHRLLWIAIALWAWATGVRSNINQRLTQNWHGLGESDCRLESDSGSDFDPSPQGREYVVEHATGRTLDESSLSSQPMDLLVYQDAVSFLDDTSGELGALVGEGSLDDGRGNSEGTADLEWVELLKRAISD